MQGLVPVRQYPVNDWGTFLERVLKDLKLSWRFRSGGDDVISVKSTGINLFIHFFGFTVFSSCSNLLWAGS